MRDRYGEIVKFTYIFPSAFEDKLIEKKGYFYIPSAYQSNNEKIVYFLLGAGCDISEFVCEDGVENDFFFKTVLDKAVEDAYVPNDVIICFLSHCERSPLENQYSKMDEILMAKNFAKNFESYVIPRVEKEVLPTILGNFHIGRDNRVLSGFSFGGGIVLAMLKELAFVFRHFMVLSAYHLEKINEPSADIRKILECEIEILNRFNAVKDLKLLGLVGEFDIAKKEMQYEFDIIKQQGVFAEKNFIFVEVEQGTHDYFTAAHCFVLGLHKIY